MRSLRLLLDSLIDYAGLFPPAQLAMAPAVANYAAYRAGPLAWALGRLIVPAARLGELAAAVGDLRARGAHADPWRLSALGGADLDADIAGIHTFNQRHSGTLLVDTIEIKAATAAEIAAAARDTQGQITLYVEIPIADDPAELIAALARAGARAKVRTGGITAAAFPPPADLLRFISACATAETPFKATAGLHHPLRAEYRLTYERDSPTGTMYGFLNVFLTAALLYAGCDPGEAGAALIEADPQAFHFDDAGVAWRARRLSNDDLARTRARLAISFGSCSFEEPIDDLRGMGLL